MVCCVLAVMGYGLMHLRRYLPAQPANALQSESDEYLRQGVPQRIDWKVLDTRAFAEARRLNRPVMLVMGTVWSREARMADQNIFVDADIQSYLSRHFVCVRIDLDAHPEWMSAFLPLTRGPSGLTNAFQIMYLDPEGRLFDFYGRAGMLPLVDPTEFIDEFVRVRRAFDGLGSGKPGTVAAGELQRTDLAVLERGASAPPRVRAFLESAMVTIHPTHGGFGVLGSQTPRPSALMALLYAGEVDAARRAIDPMLRSGFVDWLDGGFFRRAKRADWTDLDFDKVAVPNAEMMRALAVYGALADDSFAQRVSKNAFDALASEFSDTGLVATARIGDANAAGRSARSSFAAKDLRQFWSTGLLDPAQADVARRLFNLSTDSNPQMTIKISGPTVFSDPNFDALLKILRKHKEDVPVRFTMRPSAFVNATVTASMYASARIWGDENRVSQVDRRFEALSAFGIGDDIQHSTTQLFDDEPFLGDYLAVTDACVARFLVHGDLRALDRADKLLKRAEVLFGAPNGWTPLIQRNGKVIQDTNVPEVLDTPNESLTAKTIRLNNQLGRLLRGSADSTAAGRRIEAAMTIATHLGGFMHELSLPASGFFAAAMPLFDDGHAFYVGPRAVERSSALFRLVPTRLVGPAIGPVHRDLQKRAPGYYVVRGAQVLGPLSLEAAAAELGTAYRVPDGMP